MSKKFLIFFFISSIAVLAILFLLLMYPAWTSYDTVVLDVTKLTPEHYFELTEEDLSKYPALRKVLEEMESKERKIVKIVPKEKGLGVLEYLSQRQSEVGSTELADACFKYKESLYTFRGHNYSTSFVIEIDRLVEPKHYFELTEEDLSKYPALRKVLEEMESKESVLYYIRKDEGYAIFDYLLERQIQVGTPSSSIPCVAQFKYKEEFYCFNLMT